MNPRDPFKADDAGSDELDRKIREALKEEGVIIPKTIEDVRRAKERLRACPVTVPPYLRDSSVILEKARSEEPIEDSKIAIEQHAILDRESKTTKARHRATDEFVEAVVIAQLTRLLGTPDYPLGPLRCQKFAYLSHRKAGDNVSEHFVKQPAGPYSPWARYKGPENIALKKGYVKHAEAGVYSGLVAGAEIDKIDQYLPHYPVCAAVDWVVDKLRYRPKDDLELLATVDFAALDLIRQGTAVTLETIKHLIAANKKWAPKLNRAIFSDENITRALAELRGLFPGTYA